MNDKNEINIWGIVKYLLESKKIIIYVTMICLIVATVYNFFVVKNIYGRTMGLSLPAEVDDRNLYNIVLILEANKGKDSFVGARNITGSTIINLYYENSDINKLQSDSDSYTKICLQKVNDYVANIERYKQERKNTEEIKQSLKFMVLSAGNDKDLNTRLTAINEKLDEKEVVKKTTIFSDSHVSSQPIKPNKRNNIAAFTMFGFFIACTFVLCRYYKEH